MLGPRDLQEIRSAALDAMPDRCSVRRWNPLSGQWQEVASCACRIVPRAATVRGSDGILEGAFVWRVYMPHDAPAQPGDRIVVGDVAFRVTDTDRGASDLPALCVTAVRVT